MSQIKLSLSIRDTAEFRTLIDGLKELQSDIEQGIMVSEDIQERLAELLEPWEDDD